MTSAAFAQTVTPATGLGQSWPNATDQSRSRHWHVYAFRLNGIEYVQINDLNGIVHAAVGMAGGTSVALPVGTDAPNVHTDAAPTSSATTQTVYRDSTTTITATPQSNGATVFAVANICQDPYNCGGGGGAIRRTFQPFHRRAPQQPVPSTQGRPCMRDKPELSELQHTDLYY